MDAKGNLVTSEANDIWVSPASPQTASFEYDLKNVAPWSAEHPTLYKFVMTIKEEGKVIEVVPFDVGFRRFETRQIVQVGETENLIRSYCSMGDRLSSRVSIFMSITRKPDIPLPRNSCVRISS